MASFRTTRMSGVDRGRETRFSSHCGESSHCTARARWQLLRAAVGGPSRDSLVTVRARSRWVGRPAAGQFQASMSGIKIPGSAWRLLVSSGSAVRGINERLDHGRGSRMGGDERGQDAGPPVHAVRSGTSSSWTG